MPACACFLALGTGGMFSCAWHWCCKSASSSDWFIWSFTFAVIGQMALWCPAFQSMLVFQSVFFGISDGLNVWVSDFNKSTQSTKLILLFTNPSTDGRYKDCRAAAGLEKRQIPDEQVSASSFIKGHHPSQGRLNNEVKQVNGSTLWGSWCAKTEDVFQYIQVPVHTSFMCQTSNNCKESFAHSR